MLFHMKIDMWLSEYTSSNLLTNVEYKPIGLIQ